MDDYLGWQAGSLKLGMYRKGPMREVHVYAIGFQPRETGNSHLHHLICEAPSITDDFGNLVPIADWRRLHEDIEA